MGGHHRDSISGHPRLPLLAGGGDPWSACELDDRPEHADERPVVAAHAVDCLWGCRGTTACLCGQGELSDDPRWIERDLGDH